jgi:glyoxylase-like metal-dependent hydrolase (beta-lactamase superfamily II)
MAATRRSATTRRSFIAGAAALAASPALAKAPMAGAAPPTYRLKAGDIEITAFSDGYLDAPLKLFAGVDETEATRALAADFRPAGPTVRLGVNAFVVNTGDKLILVDSGTIPSFAPSLAKLPERLQAAGFKPEDFDAVLMTHLHPDHVGALTAGAGEARFTKAEFVCSAAEHKFWWDDGIMSQAPKDAQGFFMAARAASKPYDKVLRTFDKDGEVLKGISSLALPGHTPGHTGYIIGSGADALLIWGDIVHSPSIQFPYPNATVAFDADPHQAAATRKAIFDRVTADKTLVAGMHMDFPAFAHVEKAATGYRVLPQRWRID